MPIRHRQQGTCRPGAGRPQSCIQPTLDSVTVPNLPSLLTMHAHMWKGCIAPHKHSVCIPTCNHLHHVQHHRSQRSAGHQATSAGNHHRQILALWTNMGKWVTEQRKPSLTAQSVPSGRNIMISWQLQGALGTPTGRKRSCSSCQYSLARLPTVHLRVPPRATATSKPACTPTQLPFSTQLHSHIRAPCMQASPTCSAPMQLHHGLQLPSLCGHMFTALRPPSPLHMGQARTQQQQHTHQCSQCRIKGDTISAHNAAAAHAWTPE